MEGYKWMFNEAFVIVWLAPNYFYRCGNIASILEFDEYLKQQFRIFEAVSMDNRRVSVRKLVPDYLL